MRTINKVSKALCVSVALISLDPAISHATTTGNMEAINSASPGRRNIIGIEIINLTPEKKQALAYTGDGVDVTNVIPTHPAAVAGLKVGDIITKIGDFTITDMSEALENMDGLEPGQKAKFEIYRPAPAGSAGKGEKLTLNILVEAVQERAIGKIS